jgi:hypothetical protein
MGKMMSDMLALLENELPITVRAAILYGFEGFPSQHPVASVVLPYIHPIQCS